MIVGSKKLLEFWGDGFRIGECRLPETAGKQEGVSPPFQTHSMVGVWRWWRTGCPLIGGAQLAVDTTLVSPLNGDGSLDRHAADTDGVVVAIARRRKERTYHEFVGPENQGRLVVLVLERRGKLSDEALACWPRQNRAPGFWQNGEHVNFSESLHHSKRNFVLPTPSLHAWFHNLAVNPARPPR